MNAVDIYMKHVDEILQNTTDPFARKHSQLLREIIHIIAMDNWIKYGEPILSQEQMDEVYVKAKNQSGDKTWAIVGPFNLCMN